jgi:hypothetical protein
MIEWIHPLFEALEKSGLGLSIRNAHTLYPLANIGHVLAVAIFFALVAAMDMAVLRGRETAAQTIAAARPFALAAFAALVLTGGIMFIAEAGALVRNGAFQLKIAAILISGLNLWLFGKLAGGRMWLAKAPAALSLVLWLVAIAAGRGIAYL